MSLRGRQNGEPGADLTRLEICCQRRTHLSCLRPLTQHWNQAWGIYRGKSASLFFRMYIGIAVGGVQGGKLCL